MSDFKELKPVLDKYGKVPGSLITILQQTQDIYKYRCAYCKFKREQIRISNIFVLKNMQIISQPYKIPVSIPFPVRKAVKYTLQKWKRMETEKQDCHRHRHNVKCRIDSLFLFHTCPLFFEILFTLFFSSTTV